MRKAHPMLVTGSILLAAGAIARADPAPRRNPDGAAVATIRNFAPDDILAGHDGLQPHPAAPLRYGAPLLRVDEDGDVIEEHAATVAFFQGRYYLYGEKWACGKIVFFSGRIPGAAKAPTYPAGDYGGECGIASWSSPDLTKWRKETLYKPRGVDGSPSKPQVVWSPGLRKYVLWFKAGGNFARTGGLYYALSDRPGGPWGDPQVATGDHLAHDFDIAVAPDGTGYIVTDSFSGQFDKDSPGGSKPLWNVWVQQLNRDMTGTVGTPDSQVLVMTAADFEAVGFFHHGGNWYVTGGPTCGNCQVPIGYIRAASPLGVWTNEAGSSGSDLREGTMIAADGCTGQNKGADMLPSARGPVVLSAVWGYRTSPSNYAQNGQVVHGDNSQAISSTYWFPVRFDSAGRIVTFRCPATVTVPLAQTVRRSPTAPPPFQPDCRIRNGFVVEQRWRRPLGQGLLKLPVFQRTDDRGPFDQGGPVVNAPLTIEALLSDGSRVSRSLSASDVSWAPSTVALSIGRKAAIVSVALRSTATNGCYGVLVAPDPGRNGAYSTATVGKDAHVLPGVEMMTR